MHQIGGAYHMVQPYPLLLQIIQSCITHMTSHLMRCHMSNSRPSAIWSPSNLHLMHCCLPPLQYDWCHLESLYWNISQLPTWPFVRTYICLFCFLHVCFPPYVMMSLVCAFLCTIPSQKKTRVFSRKKHDTNATAIKIQGGGEKTTTASTRIGNRVNPST